MIARLGLAVVVACAVIAAPSAVGSPARSVPIRVGVGIGPINLGMTEKQVRRALGRPSGVVERRVVRGQPYVKLQWGYGTWDVGLLGRKGRRRVVVVLTSLERHRTPQGLGVGSTQRQVARRLPGTRERICGFGIAEWYLRRGSAETVFHAGGTGPPVADAVDVRMAPALGCAF